MANTLVDELWPATLLAWIAGFVDALGYLSLSHVFTAHMSGNSASLGAQLGHGNWQEVMIRGLAIPPFIIGIALGVLVDAAAARRGKQRAQLVPAFALELLCLLAFICLRQPDSSKLLRPGTPHFYVLMSLLAIAMGLQNATLRRAGGTKVRTTYISGMLTNMTEYAVHWLLCKFQTQTRHALHEKPHPPFGRLACKFGLIFVSFIAGACCGGFGQTTWGAVSLLAPILGLVVLIAQDWLG